MDSKAKISKYCSIKTKELYASSALYVSRFLTTYKNITLYSLRLLFSVLLFNSILPTIVFASDIAVDNTDATKAPQLTQTDKALPQINMVW